MAKALPKRKGSFDPDNPNNNGMKTTHRVNNTHFPHNANAQKFGTYSEDRVKPQDKASDYTWRDAYARAKSTSKKKRKRSK